VCTNAYMYDVRNNSIEHIIVSYLDQRLNVSEWNGLKPSACLSESITMSLYHINILSLYMKK